MTTATEGAGGGAITLNAGFRIGLTDSVITTTVRGGGGDAGDITANARFIILDGSQIIANAFEGRGGNIRIQAQQAFLADPASTVSASSTLGISGTVDIRAPVTNVSGSLGPLPQAFAPAAQLLHNRCAARRREGKTSRFVLAGRDGVPEGPDSPLASPLGVGGPVEVAASTAPPGHGAVTRESRAPERGAQRVAGVPGDDKCSRVRGTQGRPARGQHGRFLSAPVRQDAPR